MSRRLWLAAALVLTSSSFVTADSKESGAKTASPDKETLEKDFAKTLSGATLVGRFTVDGRSETGKTNSDRYEIEKAEKIAGHRWMITSRIKYGKHDLKLPIPLEVYWAGDTPVITLTHVMVPGLGTFTSRVMVYGDRYAGTWQHDKVGGHMWGRIEHGATPAPKEGETKKETEGETKKEAETKTP